MKVRMYIHKLFASEVCKILRYVEVCENKRKNGDWSIFFITNTILGTYEKARSFDTGSQNIFKLN